MRRNRHHGHPRRHPYRVPLFLTALAFLIGLQAATQHCAHAFDHDPILGMRLGTFYPPWAVLLWARYWYPLFPGLFHSATYVGCIFFSAASALSLRYCPRHEDTDTLHGSARWASRWEILRLGLLRRDRGDSVVVGAIRGSGVGHRVPRLLPC